MDRNREARRATIAVTNGLSRRRHRSNSLRDSPEEDGLVELPETARLRDRGILKKDRDRDRERDRERDRDRDRDRLSRSKRRRGDRLMHGSNREEGEESSEESVNDEEEEDDDDGGGSVRILPPNPSSLSTSSMLNHRKSFPPPAKVFRAAPTWKAADEMIGVSVPRKARSASTKRSHECWASNGGAGGDQIHRQASTSPVRPSLVMIAEASPARPISPSSSNASARKKMKPSGPKQRPPKSSSKSSSSAQDEIEIEIAEVLYGMMRQPLGPKQEIAAIDSREANKSSSSRVSSPISNSQSVVPQSSTLPQNSSSSATPVSATAPKRKRPRPVKYEEENPSIFTVRNSPISSITKIEIEQSTKIETSSPNSERNQGSAAENGGIQYDLTSSNAGPPSSEVPPESAKLETDIISASKPLGEGSENRDVGVTKEEPQSPKTESPVLRLNDGPEDVKSTKSNSEIEIQKEEKFQIDLMAPPPPPTLRSSPEREGDIDFAGVDPKPMVQDVQTDLKPLVKENDKKAVKIGKEAEEKKAKGTVEEVESQKPILNKERLIDLQFDLEKSETERDSSNKLSQQHVQKRQQPSTEKAVQANSLPLPMSVAGWPSGLPPMGYMAPLQGVVSMDGSTVPSAAIQPPHLLSTQPRPKRCATHCYIARNICYHQQLSRMNPFWPAGAGAASLYGDKPCNLNVVPSAELHGNIAGRSVSSLQDKGPGLAMFPGHTGKDKGAQVANMVDPGQRKQIMLQQALPAGAPSNILHGPAFIFPLSQQQPVAAASVRPGSVKSPPVVGSAAPSSASNSSSVSASATAAAAAATAMSLYPNMPSNETQYLAILQNNAYPFPIPAHVGAAPAYRGAQGVPFFNGSFYTSQMLHPSQLQQQQQQQPPTQPQQAQQAHQNSSISGGSSSSQKHLQNQQQRQQASGINGSTGSVQGFPAPKNQPSHPLQRQQQQNQHFLPSHQARQLDNEMGGEDSPSTADSRVSRSNMSVYNQNFAMPIHPPNFALMSPASMGGVASGTGNNSEKKPPQQQQHQQGLKAGVETLPSQPFAMSFASINGATTSPGFDMSSIAQNHAILQGLPEATRSYQFMAAAAAAQAAQQKKNFRVSEEGKTGGGDSSTAEEQRKVMAGKASATMGHSIAFSRPDFPDKSVSSLPGNTVIDSSARAINMSSASGRSSGSVMASGIGTVNAPSSQRLQQQHQQQQQQQQQQQMLQLQKQHQFAAAAAAAARNKTPPPSNGSVYSDNLPSSSMAAKFPNALSAFPQNLVQCSSSPAQSPQWKNSVRTTTSQASSPSLASSTSSLKNLAQQQARTQPSHTQISFAANSKSSAAAQGQQSPSSNQSPSSPMVVGSPTSSMSKGAGGSPRTNASTSTGTKTAAQASSLSSQQTKNSAPMPGRKSSPVGGRTVPSILGNPHITSSSTTKPHLPQQQQQQQPQLPKQALQQAQLFYSNAFMQAPHSTSATSTATANSGYYLQRRRTEQQQQQSQGSSGTSSTGVLTLCPPVTLANASTTDPTKAVAAAAAVSSMKVGGLPSQFAAQFAAAQSSGNPHHVVPVGFPYVHTVPTAVQVKPVEQKQPAGE